MTLIGSPGKPLGIGLLGATGPRQGQSSPIANVEESHLRTRAPLALVFLMIGLLLPTEMSLNLAGLRLSPYRLVLIATIGPAIVKLRRSGAEPLHFGDKAVVLFGTWAILATLFREGPGRAVEGGGIFLIESLGSYFVARAYIRNSGDLLAMGRLLFLAMIALALVAIPEMLTGQRFIHDIAGGIFGGRQDTLVEGRMGLARAYGPFDHPILYGTFCAAGFSLSRVLSGARKNIVADSARGSLVGLTVLASLSSGCIMALLMQIGIGLYGAILRSFAGKWKLLTAVLLAAYSLVSMLSDRSGLKAILWYITLNRDTAAYRILIWEHATENITKFPIFGIGVENWVRPLWMPESVDSFWLVLSLNFGLPAVALLVAGIVWLMTRIGLRKIGGPAELRLRGAWCMTFAALLLTGFTVHYWNNVFVLFFFILGSGSWMASDRKGQA